MKNTKKLSKEYMEYLSFITRRKTIRNDDRAMRADLRKAFRIERNIKKGYYKVHGGRDDAETLVLLKLSTPVKVKLSDLDINTMYPNTIITPQEF